MRETVDDARETAGFARCSATETALGARATYATALARHPLARRVRRLLIIIALLALLLPSSGCCTASLWDWAGNDRYRFAWRDGAQECVLEDRCPDHGPVSTPGDRYGHPHRHVADRALHARELDELRAVDDAADSAWPNAARAEEALAFQVIASRPEGSRPLVPRPRPHVIVLVREGDRWTAWSLAEGKDWKSSPCDDARWAPAGGARVVLATFATPFALALDAALTPFMFFAP